MYMYKYIKIYIYMYVIADDLPPSETLRAGDRAVPRNQALAQRAHALARVLEA